MRKSREHNWNERDQGDVVQGALVKWFHFTHTHK
jgi:hypothetical protein